MDEPKLENEAKASGSRAEENKSVPEEMSVERRKSVDMSVNATVDLGKFPPEVQTELIKKYGVPQISNSLLVTGSLSAINKFYREVQEASGASNSVMEEEPMKKVLTQSQDPSSSPDEGRQNALTVPLFDFCYLSQAYRKELEQLQNEFGDKLEVSVSILPKENTKSDSVNDAIQKFAELFQEASNKMKSVRLSQTQLESDISELKMDPQAPLEMDQPVWELMKGAYQSQIADMESKYGVTFDAKSVRGSTLVKARSRESNRSDLETEAIRALMNFYQKVAMSAAVCGLKDPSKTSAVSEMFAVIRHHYPCVVSGEGHGGWKLVGLPQHLVPAIKKIEELIGCPVFDDETKQILGFPSHYSQAEMKDKREANGDAKKKESDKDKEEDKCPICMDTFTEKTKLDCGHEFCKECLKNSEKNLGKMCALCKKVYGKLIGNQPPGKMNVFRSKNTDLPGFNKCGTIEIMYDIPSGTQTHEHPNPGRHYYGTQRIAYLPNNAEGNHVLRLLGRAFDQRLIFTVGTSRTTGREDSVIWNDIHHKTSTHGGAQSFGYPDPHYLRRVKEELKAKGIE